MPHRVRYSAHAVRDLEGIYRYIAGRSGSPDVALSFVGRIRGACERLADFPERGTRRDKVRPGLRIIGLERRVSIVFYVAETEVLIARVAYGGRNLTADFIEGG